ncbi:hypothetical protein SD427_18410 [Chryseobacterium sp. JJR-5R]|uniref:hypothetical protein n=1 Tax=Chryseobacterium sp. JJR-5R TaxID=3093923 RepID=UPI002A75C8F8|nr:hypothetical protein [Chryseobacterium sp. JJR-5R]WPO82711.1 hypothetical protein SD427_18410 [Chryseobacterium sp. JJR-5R]
MAAFLLSLQSFGQEVDCEKLYNEAKEKFEKNFGDASDVDYSGLGKTILENLNMSKFTEKNLVLYVSNIIEYCPSGIPKNPCRIFKDTAYRFNEERLWTSDQILTLREKTKKNIIPVNNQNFFTEQDRFYSQFKIKNFKKGIQKMSWQINDGSELTQRGRSYYYFPYKNHVKELILMKISTHNIFLDTDTMQTIVYHPNSKEIYVNFIFENDPAKNYVQTCRYIDDQWKLTDSENGNYNSN